MEEPLYKFKIYCDTEQAWVEGWYEEDPHVCPHNDTHVIDDSKTSVVEEVHHNQVDINNMASLQEPHKNIQRVVVQPARTDHFMCDRDTKIATSEILREIAIQDLKVGTSDNKESDWGEFSLAGCYKKVGDEYVECVDQADADLNASLTVVNYLAKKQADGSPLNYDFKGGYMWSDVNLSEPKWDHRLYAVVAPDVPPSMGGGARIFDGYLYPYEGKWQEAVNTMSITIDPSVVVAAAVVRFWIYYPPGSKQHHVLRIVTFRTADSF